MNTKPTCAVLACLGLAVAGQSSASTGVDICRQPITEPNLSIAYYRQEATAFDNAPGVTNRENYRTDLLLNAGAEWSFGLDYRGTALNVDRLELQTNGYLHTFAIPVHWIRQADEESIRISISPSLSASSNVVKDPGQYSSDAFQILLAVLRKKRLSGHLDLDYGVCGDHRFGDYRVYPVFSINWQPRPDWLIEFGFPVVQVSHQASRRLGSVLRVAPNGNEWFVKDKSRQKQSRLSYRAYQFEWLVDWRAHDHLMLTVSIAREFDSRYEVTLLDETRIRIESDSATRAGLGLTWFF